MNQFQQDAIRNRSSWAEAQREAIKTAVAALAPLAVEDFRHQIGPRGCSVTAGFREANEDAENVGTAIAEALKKAIMDYMIETRRQLD